MGSLKRRLERLEEQHGPSPDAATDEETEKQRWLAMARARRNRDRGDWHAADVIGLLRNQGRLGPTTEELRARLLAWRPELDRGAVERELARTIYLREPGMENMVCPPAWREAFVAADELRERHAAVPEETVAAWMVAQHELEGGGPDEIGRRVDMERERYGLTDELLLKAAGPDAEEVGDEECSRRLREILADDYYGERGYRIQQHIDRMMADRDDNG